MARIIVDGRDLEVPLQDRDKDLLTTLLHLGFDVPYFCWHPALGSVGACRQCAVKLYRDPDDEDGRIVMSCMTPVDDDMRVSVDDPEAIAYRRRVIEWLMVNHPHDCPICDEGGECHLQDMAVLTGHTYRRYRGRKRTYRNQDLGPFIDHEMNRCIQCYRCVRFYCDHAGGADLQAFGSKDYVYFGRFEDGRLESEFSGNLVEVCPTGVFTDKTLKSHYTRKWDLESAPSVCVHCGLGCNIIPGARYGTLRRIYSRFHPEINRHFICDRGRFGYEFVNQPDRLRQPTVGRNREESVEWPDAIGKTVEALAACSRVLGVGSPRASLESNFALQVLVGEESFSTGLSAPEQVSLTEGIEIMRTGQARAASLSDVESSDAILVLGADPANEAPMLELAIRQAVHRGRLTASRALGIPDWDDGAVRTAVQGVPGGGLYIASVAPMRLDAIATEAQRAPPPELHALGFEIADRVRDGGRADGDSASRVATALVTAERPLVVVSAAGGEGVLHAAANITGALSARSGTPCALAMLVPECNSVGAALLGGCSLDDVLDEAEAGRADGLIVLENDLFRRAPRPRVERALRSLRRLVVIDHLANDTTAAADLSLPAATFAESTGTLVNYEGRAQRFHQVFVAESDPRPSWQILRDLIEAQRPGTANWASAEKITRALVEARPDLAPAAEAAPPAAWRDRVGRRVARESHRHSGRTAVHAHLTPRDPQPPGAPGSPLAFSMEGAQANVPAALTPRHWRPGWNSVQSLHGRAVEPPDPRQMRAQGARLLDSGGEELQPFPAPEAEPPRDDEIWLVRGAVIFGTDEVSRRARAVRSVIPPASLRIHPQDAERLSLAKGETARFCLGEELYELPVELDSGLAPGVVVAPAGYPETGGTQGTARVRIERAP
jgi:NADH-quinone oxidoreductase subunit G